ncbi:MAG: penicillin-binding transpeptidase domain-containing protein [Phototrophicaceae bacterium]
MRRIAVLLLFMIVGCAPQNQPVIREVDLPTLVPLPTVPLDLQEPARIATAFLGAWQTQDFATMYSLLAFNTQEAITLEDFRVLYLDTQDTMTFEAVTFEAVSMAPVGSRTVQLSYNVTFQTRLLGMIEDNGRTLTVISDQQAGFWRVAWTAGDIFAELGNGARLEFQPNAPGRANIYARDGEIIADMQGRIVEVFVVQDDVEDWDTCRSTLDQITDVNAERVDQIFANSQPSWSTRVGRIESTVYSDDRQREKLINDCDASFEGVAIRRYHPNGSVMPHVLGYVGLPSPEQVDGLVRQGFNAETIIGQAGIEQSWNDTLMGTPGGRLQLINADGSRARVLAEATSQISESIWLTIDLSLQQFIIDTFNREYLQNGLNADDSLGWGARSPGAAAIVMNVNTGEILAMVSYPTYDGNAYTTYPAIGREIANQVQLEVAEDDRNPLLNRATQGLYPAGSVFKVVDAIAVLDTGVYDANTNYFCSGLWEHEGDFRDDWLGGGHGSVNTRTAIRGSCNPFFYETGFVLNNADPYFLPNYARRLGLGVPTGLTDLPEETGQIPDPDSALRLTGIPWSYANAVNLSIGQGEIAITPLQMVRMYAAIANGGNLMQPYLVRESGILNQRTPVNEPTITSQFDVSQATLDIVQAGLCDVTTVELYGTATHVFRGSQLMDTIGVCGKTGTAQASGDQFPYSWFASYAPADTPEIAVVVMIENAGDGSAIAAPITRQILEYYYFLND